MILPTNSQVLALAETAFIAVAFSAFFSRFINSFGEPETEQDDEEVIQAHQFCLDILNDEQKVKEIEALTGRNLRDQVSAHEANEMYREIRLRQMKNRN